MSSSLRFFSPERSKSSAVTVEHNGSSRFSPDTRARSCAAWDRTGHGVMTAEEILHWRAPENLDIRHIAGILHTEANARAEVLLGGDMAKPAARLDLGLRQGHRRASVDLVPEASELMGNRVGFRVSRTHRQPRFKLPHLNPNSRTIVRPHAGEHQCRAIW